jgi:hypothetical protein
MASERSPGPYVAIAVLVALLVAAIGFVVAMVMRPNVVPATALVATDRVPITCASTQKDTTCFDTQISNQGTLASGFTCQVVAYGDTAATFADGAPTYELTLGPSESAHIGTIVTAHGDVEAVAPRVQCAPVQA